MSNRQILVKNTLWLGLVEAVSKVIMFGVTVSIVRYLGPSEYGIFNLAFAYVSMFMILGDFGMGTVATREIAKRKEDTKKYLSNLLGLKIGLSGIIVILIILSMFLVTNQTNQQMIFAVLLYSLLMNINSVFPAIFGAWEKMELVFVSRLVYYLGILTSAIGVIYFKGTAMDIVVAYSVATFISFWLSSRLLTKINVKIGISFDFKFVKYLLIETMPFMGLTIVGTIFANNDTLLIGKYFGSEQTGFYQSAYKVLFAFQSINLINNAIFPRINVLLHENKLETLNKLIRIVVGYSILGLVPLAILITYFQSQIITIIYGANFISAAPAMAILVWSGVISYFRVLTSNLLFARNNQQQVFVAVAIGLLLNLAINLIILPSTNFVTAAWSVLIAEVVILGVTLKYLK